MKATLTIAGLYNYRPDIFDNFILPDGVDKDTLVFTILEECAALEIRFPDADYLKLSIEKWSKAMLNSWTRRLDAMLKQYDPIENYDRMEDSTETVNSAGEGTTAKTAYDEDTFKNTDKNVNSGNMDRTFKSRIHGNIGVVTAAKMISETLDLTERLNFYWTVMEDFKYQYCITVY